MLALPENLGYGTGMNRGVAHGPRADFYVLANPDLTFGTGAIDELLRAAEAEPRSGSLGPAIFNVDGSLYPSARPLPALGTGIGHALFSRTWPSNPWTRSYRMTLADGRSRAVGWLSGACLFVRADVFHAVGGFDERYFMYFEDVDFGRRVGLAGYRNVYVPSRPRHAPRCALHLRGVDLDGAGAPRQRLPVPLGRLFRGSARSAPRRLEGRARRAGTTARPPCEERQRLAARMDARSAVRIRERVTPPHARDSHAVSISCSSGRSTSSRITHAPGESRSASSGTAG